MISNTRSPKTTPTRDRILSAARHLFQQRGYYGVGTAEILAAAKAPKGSMYHHFPDGKEQIAIEVVNSIASDIAKTMDAMEASNLSLSEMIRKLGKGMARWLKESSWREGTMLASTTIGSVPDLPKLHAAIRKASNDWRIRLAQILERDGSTKVEAKSMAQTIIAALEGAMILARIDQDERVLSDVADLLVKCLRISKPS